VTETDGPTQAGEMGDGAKAYADLVGTQTEVNQTSEVPYSVETPLGTVVVISHRETTRGSGAVELSGEKFGRDAVVFTGLRDHLSIHQGGEIAGSQFKGEVFANAAVLEGFLQQALPAEIQYDQSGMVEMTLEIQLPDNESIGYSGIKSIEDIQTAGIAVAKGMRLPGGEPGIEDAKTNKVSIVMRKDPTSGRPVVLTAYPGEIAPPFPAKITTEAFSADSLRDGKAADYWQTHAFIKFAS